MKKLFGGIKLTWPKLILWSIIAGVYTAIMAIIPALRYTSFNTITVTFEVWILIGIIIIMNSKSNLDAALKCFIFFLISMPLVYLIQVPFSWQGWGLFKYYRYWFIWTLLTIPMGYVGYYMKKGKWWGYLILFPMIGLLAYHLSLYFSYMLFSFPKYILITLFCIVTMIICPYYIFENKKIKTVGVIISAVFIAAVISLCLMKPLVYSTDILISSEKNDFDDTYKVYFKDSKYGDIKIVYEENIESYLVHVDFKKEGKTEVVLESPSGEKKVYDLVIKRDTYSIDEK